MEDSTKGLTMTVPLARWRRRRARLPRRRIADGAACATDGAGADSANERERGVDRSTTEHSASRNGTLTNDVEELLLRIRGLIFARAILEQRGATEVELEEHRLEIERLRWRLASLMRGGPADSDTAA